jgi:hypothetical protein
MHGERGGILYLAEKADVNYNSAKGFVDNLVMAYYIQMETAGSGDDRKVRYTVTSLGHRYLNQHQDELGVDPAEPEPAEEKTEAPQPDPECGYCRRRGSPCVKHGGEPSITAKQTSDLKQPEGSHPWRSQLVKKSDPPLPPAARESVKVIDIPAVPLDSEIADMHQLFTLLQKYDEAARERMMAYVNARLDK